MKTSKLKKRLKQERPMAMVSIRMPVDVVDDLKRMAPKLGFSGYQPLIRAYVGQSLRLDLERLDNEVVNQFISRLKKHGVSQKVIKEALSEAVHV